MSHSHHSPSYWSRCHTESVVLDIGDDVGALVLYVGPELHRREIELSPVDNDAARVHSAVLEREVNGVRMFAAVYPELRPGDYRVWHDPPQRVTISAGAVAELHAED